MLDTTVGARILRGADQASHKMEADMQSLKTFLTIARVVALFPQVSLSLPVATGPLKLPKLRTAVI